VAEQRVLPGPDELAGLVPGPASVTWRVAGDARLLAAAGYALVLQVAHPTVAAGVTQYSSFASDPWGRLLRTLDYLNGTVYGGPETAGEIGRRVRRAHRPIKGVTASGERYHALEPHAFAWVHATLAAAIVQASARLGRALSAGEREQFWREWRALGRLVGVRDRDLPGDWDGFEAYFARMVADELGDEPTVHEVLDAFGGAPPPPIPGLPAPVWGAVRRPLALPMRLVTVGLLPPVLRGRFGLGWTPAHEAAFTAICVSSRATTPLLPPAVRLFGPRYLRLRRRALERGDVGAAPPPPRAVALRARGG
jgi:uncharacterized protein (DUF2236 family)